jgi:hypothetical protein
MLFWGGRRDKLLNYGVTAGYPIAYFEPCFVFVKKSSTIATTNRKVGLCEAGTVHASIFEADSIPADETILT